MKVNEWFPFCSFPSYCILEWEVDSDINIDLKAVHLLVPHETFLDEIWNIDTAFINLLAAIVHFVQAYQALLYKKKLEQKRSLGLFK